MKPPDQLSPLASSCWVAVAILAAFLCTTQLLVMLSVMAGHFGLVLAAPLGLLLAFLLGDRLARQLGLTGRARWQPSVLAFTILAASIAISAWYLDLSWDGEWYHQTGVYAIARDWNPLADPMRNFLPHLQLWVRHYAKGPWYVAAAMYRTTGFIEWGKSTAVVAWASMGLAVFAAALDWGMRRSRAAAIALLVALNPVAMSEITTYLVDGIMVGFLVTVVAAMFSGFQRPRPVLFWVGGLATIVCINAKLTGLVFLCFAFLAGWIWCAIFHRGRLWRYTAWTAAALFVGALVFGYNPYITNAIHRHQPFYPVLGSKAFPSLTQQGREGIEIYETPKNILGHSRFFRLAFVTFGRPGNAPYHHQPNAELMWPFTARLADLYCYHYHETRVAGFGPFFSGALLFSLALGVWLLFQKSMARWAALLTAAAIIASLLISLHLWWPRYGPQLWLLPIVPLVFVFYMAQSKWVLRSAWALLALLLVNAAIVAAVRMKWETNGTITLRRQLTELSQPGKEIDVALNYFEIPVGERLKRWGVHYHMKSRREMRDGTVLMSVVDDYPLEIRYKVLPPAAAGPPK